jgi:head-tail adaptor
MEAGNQDRRITLQRQQVLDGEYGPQPTGEWEDVPRFVRIPAQVQDNLPSRSEQVQNGARLAERVARVRMRWTRGVTSDMRVIVHNDVDEVFQMSSPPAEIGRREWIEFVITEYSSDHGPA